MIDQNCCRFIFCCLSKQIISALATFKNRKLYLLKPRRYLVVWHHVGIAEIASMETSERSAGPRLRTLCHFVALNPSLALFLHHMELFTLSYCSLTQRCHKLYKVSLQCYNIIPCRICAGYDFFVWSRRRWGWSSLVVPCPFGIALWGEMRSPSSLPLRLWKVKLNVPEEDFFFRYSPSRLQCSEYSCTFLQRVNE